MDDDGAYFYGVPGAGPSAGGPQEDHVIDPAEAAAFLGDLEAAIAASLDAGDDDVDDALAGGFDVIALSGPGRGGSDGGGLGGRGGVPAAAAAASTSAGGVAAAAAPPAAGRGGPAKMSWAARIAATAPPSAAAAAAPAPPPAPAPASPVAMPLPVPAAVSAAAQLELFFAQAAAAAAAAAAPPPPPAAAYPLPPQPPRPLDSRPLCTYFMAGGCRYGDGCRFRHAAADPACVDFFEAEIDRMIQADRQRAAELGLGDGSGGAGTDGVPAAAAAAAGGASSSGSAATSASSAGGSGDPDAAPSSGDAAADAAFAADTEAWLASGMANRLALIDAAIAAGLAVDATDAETALAMAERNVSADIECAICMEPVTAVPGRRFGLLTSCTHAFCLECIREWRGRIDLPVETTRSCPVCRQLSYLVIPCDRFIADEGRKAVVSREYHDAQRTIPCRHFNYGKGTCPFGSSCFYAHTNPDGTPAVQPKHVVRVDADGNVGVTRAFKLNEFLFR